VDARFPTILVDSDADGVAVLRLLGEHDVSSADVLGHRLLAAVRASKNVVVDVSETAFLDSTTVNKLIEAHTEFRRAGRRLVLQYGARTVIRRVIETLGLLDVFPHAAERTDAVRLALEADAAGDQQGLVEQVATLG
jgi:anti-anti-sigma factor